MYDHQPPAAGEHMTDRPVIDWLLEGDPSIRWQVLRDLLDAPDDQVRAERERVAGEGWGAALLDAQRPDGTWGGGANFPEWTGTKPTLAVLRLLGPIPTDPRVQEAIARVRANVRWEYDDLPFFDGEVEPCINGSTVAIATYFGQDVTPIVERLLTEQMADGGWNCEQENGSIRGSFDTTINVLEGLLEYERAHGARADITAARERGQEYLLERRLLRRLSTGEVIEPAYRHFFFPTRWHYDVLRGLGYFREAGVALDERMTEALDLVEERRGPDGRWVMEHEYPGETHFPLDEGVGRPSRWITLRALRVLRWAGRGGAQAEPIDRALAGAAGAGSDAPAAERFANSSSTSAMSGRGPDPADSSRGKVESLANSSSTSVSDGSGHDGGGATR
jgi:hypothetical protein